MTPEEFNEWVAGAAHGARFTYHAGLLMADRVPMDGADTAAQALDDLAVAVIEAAERGRVALVQERVEPLVCRYHAIRVKK